MSITRKIAMIAAVAGIGASQLVALAAPAAADYRGPHRGDSSVRRDWGGTTPGYLHRPQPRVHHYAPPHRHHKRDRVGPAVALGLGALMLGIIASEASRNHGPDYD